MLPFEQSEYERRVDNAKSRMVERGLDALIVANPNNICYLTGYDIWSHKDPQVVLVPRKGEPIWYGRGIDESGARKTTWLSAENVRSYETVHSELSGFLSGEWPHPLSGAAEILRELGLEAGTIGVETALPYLHVCSLREFTESLPEATFEDASRLVTRDKVVKSDAEIEYMRQAAELSERGLRAAIETIDDGVRESTVAGKVYEALIGGTTEFGGNYPANPPLLGAGDMNEDPHFTWSADGTYRRDDPVSVEISGCRHRYHAPLSRTVYVGEPPAEFRESVADVREGLETVVRAAEPGVTCEDVVDSWREVVDSELAQRNVKLGYSIGVGVASTWSDPGGPTFRNGDETFLQPGMTFHMLSTHTFDQEISVEMSDTVIVTENGSEPLHDVPRQLFATA